MGRHSLYIGALGECESEELEKYEREGGWVASRKIDGMWIVCETGEPNVLTSRNKKSVNGKSADDLLKLPVPEHGLSLIGELLAATEWAVAETARLGYRAVMLFDLARDELGRELYYELTWWERFQLLKQKHSSWPEEVQKKLKLVEVRESGFRQFFDEEVAAGREGLMLWRKDQKLNGGRRRASGKEHELVKVKRMVDCSFVLIGVTRTDVGDNLTGRWGLYDAAGNLVDVMQAGVPGLTEETREELIGRVADFQGFCQFRSGALRSARFKNWRDDLDACDCVLPKLRK